VGVEKLSPVKNDVKRVAALEMTVLDYTFFCYAFNPLALSDKAFILLALT
jgi:hypothetical protein